MPLLKRVRLLPAILAFVAVTDAGAQNPFRHIFPFQRESSQREQPARSRQTSRPTRSQDSNRSSSAASVSSSSSSSTSTPKATGSAIGRPSVISTPGRYVLSGNLNAQENATTAAVVITAPNVTLDLGGYTIRSRGSGSPDNCGVAVLADSVLIRNGVISGFAGENQCGVLVAAGVRNFVLEDVRLNDCETGILLNPENDLNHPVESARISRCSITSGSIGILAFPTLGLTVDSSTVSGCVPRRDVEGEGSGAVLRGQAVTVRNSSFTSCTDGLRLEADSSLLVETACVGNLETGCIVSGNATLVQRCSFSGNRGDGLSIAAEAVQVESSLASFNGGNGVVLEEIAGGGNDHPAGIVLYQVTASGNGGAEFAGRAGGSVLDGCSTAGGAGSRVELKETDVYRNCIFPAPPQGGRDGGGNFVTGGQG